MICFRNKIVGCTIALVLAALLSQGQVLVRSTIDKDYILVGESAKLTVEARLPLGQKVSWFILDTIPHFEWVEKGMVNETDGIDGKTIQQVFTITSYDTGYWQVPRVSIRVDGKSYSTDTVGVRVEYSPGFNPADEYRDIKETEEVKSPEAAGRRWWIFAIAGVLLLVLIYFFLRKKPVAKPEKRVVVALTPYEEAIQALSTLRKSRPADAESVKLYYTRLNDIFRNFLSREHNIASLAKTNDELIVPIKALSLSQNQFTELVQILRLSDFVKFARYQPADSDHEKSIAVIESAIKSLYKPPAAA
jgi:hypothetical protein